MKHLLGKEGEMDGEEPRRSLVEIQRWAVVTVIPSLAMCGSQALLHTTYGTHSLPDACKRSDARQVEMGRSELSLRICFTK